MSSEALSSREMEPTSEIEPLTTGGPSSSICPCHEPIRSEIENVVVFDCGTNAIRQQDNS